MKSVPTVILTQHVRLSGSEYLVDGRLGAHDFLGELQDGLKPVVVVRRNRNPGPAEDNSHNIRRCDLRSNVRNWKLPLN